MRTAEAGVGDGGRFASFELTEPAKADLPALGRRRLSRRSRRRLARRDR